MTVLAAKLAKDTFIMTTYKLLLTSIISLALLSCSNEQQQILADATGLPGVELTDRVAINEKQLLNAEATVPPMCYTKTEQKHNPCYVCHQAYPESNNAKSQYRYNKLSDFGLQGGYLFSEEGTQNHWSNLFIDREQWVNNISDSAIIEYTNQDNYSDLANRLKKMGWQGYVPDLNNYQDPALAFDDKGFAKDNSGWVAFNYKPLPSTFWPTNGATDDVLIRLPAKFRQNKQQNNEAIYHLNLSLLELNIKQLPTISIYPINEKLLNRDINDDGMLSEMVQTLSRQPHYFGDATNISVTPQQFPKGTELMHSLRYLGIDEQDNITVSRRIKELRYMKKFKLLSEADIDNRFRRERKEKVEEELPYFVNHRDEGFENGYGWKVHAFIEDYNGELRPQSFEERMFCMGCHSAVGTTIDHTFSMARKVTGAKGWGYINLKGMKDAPSISEPGGEILNYLKRVSGGNEFRANQEIQQKWFNDDGSLKLDEISSSDVYQLITPSKERALKLNKAYTHIVRHQSYIYGRDPNIKPLKNVHKKVDESQAPLNIDARISGWDIRLDWNTPAKTSTKNHPDKYAKNSKPSQK
ncbi:hypothetical protein C8D97_10323 [Pleionea mediterranea]|uniref:Lipoprotein n=2 Tax=Pleionea mediterranea TaxID=523701 RepID=A0A316G076_9GAMM|nr:hypothetical protein C8D97_10323 [Pleionea mediterranea]